jgi:hypothetical protein
MMSGQASVINYLAELVTVRFEEGMYSPRKPFYAARGKEADFPRELALMAKSEADLDIGYICAALSRGLVFGLGHYDSVGLSLDLSFSNRLLDVATRPATSYGCNILGGNRALNRLTFLCLCPSAALAFGTVFGGNIALNVGRRLQPMTVFSDIPNRDYFDLTTFQNTPMETERMMGWVHYCVRLLSKFVAGVTYSEMMEYIAACALSIFAQEGLDGDTLTNRVVTRCGLEEPSFLFSEYVILRWLLTQCQFAGNEARPWTAGQLHTSVVNLKAIAAIDYQRFWNADSHLQVSEKPIPKIVHLIGQDEFDITGGSIRFMANMYALTLYFGPSDYDALKTVKLSSKTAREMTVSLESTDWTFQIKFQNLMARLLGTCDGVRINGVPWENYDRANLDLANHRLVGVGGAPLNAPTKIFLWTLPMWAEELMPSDGSLLINIRGNGMVNRHAGYVVAKSSEYDSANYAVLANFINRLGGMVA